MKKFIFVLALIPGFGFAQVCSQSQVKKRVLTAAYLLERMNGGGAPLATKIYSYSSKENTWAVLFSYSGVQHIWSVETSDDGCFIQKVSK